MARSLNGVWYEALWRRGGLLSGRSGRRGNLRAGWCAWHGWNNASKLIVRTIWAEKWMTQAQAAWHWVRVSDGPDASIDHVLEAAFETGQLMMGRAVARAQSHPQLRSFPAKLRKLKENGSFNGQ